MQHFIYSSHSDGPVFVLFLGVPFFLRSTIPYTHPPAVEILAVTLVCYPVLATCTASRILPVGLYDYGDDVYYV